MTLPREVLPGRCYLVTRRCTQRMFLMRPDAATNNAFVYCLAVAAERAGIDVLFTCALSNHHHTVIHDRDGTYPAFIEHFHKLFAKSQNALRGRWENLWASEKTSVVRLVDTAAIIDKIVYTATNPVKDHLVARATQWPGVNPLVAFCKNRMVKARRPAHFFRAAGSMPREVKLSFRLPAELEPTRDKIILAVQEGVRLAEERAAQERRRTGRELLGRRGCKKQRWQARSTSFEPRRVLSPTVATRSIWSRIEALSRNREFLAAYRNARAQWLSLKRAEFPPGTYWLHRFANIQTVASTNGVSSNARQALVDEGEQLAAASKT